MNNNLVKLKGQLKENHLLAPYTSWKVGGPAEYFYQPKDLEDLKQLLKNSSQEPITILGAATNVLVRDKGIKGLVIYLRNTLDGLQIIDNRTLRVETGANLSQLVKKCSELGFIDSVFMAGVPGTVGGALKMNAGAYGDNIWNHVTAVETINRHGEIKIKEATAFKASYREISGLANDEWFIAGHLIFKQGNIDETKKQIQNYLQKRSASQPLNFPSCGSVFRNPAEDYAARLIEASGLKGKQIGNAEVSEKHANFIVNLGNATATDIENLIQEVITTVNERTGITLQTEVLMLGEK